jgi:SWI/SNF-related matrix-associated actin-dependent regulator of chromatin subfamily A member 5
MLFRCRWCERGYCEDCLDWDKTELIGENLKEYELLGFPAVTQAFYISCPSCADHHEDNQQSREFCERQAAQIDAQYSALVEERERLAAASEDAKKEPLLPSRAESLTDATTLNDSDVTTPHVELTDPVTSSGGKLKRRAAPGTFKTTPTKRSKRLTA